MKTILSTPLSLYLSRQSGQAGSPSDYIRQGAACLEPADLIAMRSLLPKVTEKVSAIADSKRLQRRIEMLVQFFRESADRSADPATKEAAFALFYFLKGEDFIPDNIPEVGLLDDALLIETVFRRNQLELRTHWESRERVWPENS